MSVGLALFSCRGLQKSSATWKPRSATFHGVDDFMVGNVSSGLQLKKAQALLAALSLKKKKYQWLFLLMEFFSFWLICSTAFVWFLIPVPLQVAGDIETLVLFLLIPLVNWYDHKKRNPVLSRTFEVLSQPILQLHQQSWEWSMDLTKAPPSSTHSPPSSADCFLTVFLVTGDARPCLWMGPIHHSS